MLLAAPLLCKRPQGHAHIHSRSLIDRFDHIALDARCQCAAPSTPAHTTRAAIQLTAAAIKTVGVLLVVAICTAAFSQATLFSPPSSSTLTPGAWSFHGAFDAILPPYWQGQGENVQLSPAGMEAGAGRRGWVGGIGVGDIAGQVQGVGTWVEG